MSICWSVSLLSIQLSFVAMMALAGVMQLQDWVGERPSDAEVSQGRSDRTNDDQFGIGASDDEAANPNIGASSHVHSSREVLGLACRGAALVVVKVASSPLVVPLSFVAVTRK